MKNTIKKILPKKILLAYHYLIAVVATLFYGSPCKKMIVIGITGTKGKTSTANFIWSVLQNCGIKTGILSTANLRIGDKEILNPFHMTMPGRFKVQGILKQMAEGGCECAIVETTSQGLEQFRHIGIWYDFLVFTNLFPEHIDSHGSFENYKNAKGKMFKYLGAFGRKKIKGVEIPKTIILNADDAHFQFFHDFKADKKITFGIGANCDYKAESIVEDASSVSFKVNGGGYTISIPGRFNIPNALPAIVIGEILGNKYLDIRNGLQNLALIPGRMEAIQEGQGYKVYVDYAHEKQSMSGVLDTAKKMVQNGGKIIVLLGAEGGGRDKSKRPIMGEVAGKLADYVVVSNVDPYEDDPLPIAEDIATAAEVAGKIRDENLFVILDRREGIRKALSLANEKDIVLITGKGAEQSMIMGVKKIPWDDRTVVREEIKKLLAGSF